MSIDAARTALCFSPFEPCDCFADNSCTMFWTKINSAAPNRTHNLSQYDSSLLLHSAHDKCCPTITVALKHNTVFCFEKKRKKNIFESHMKIWNIQIPTNEREKERESTAQTTKHRTNDIRAITTESSNRTGTHKCVQRALQRVYRFDRFLFMHVFTSSARFCENWN